MSVRDMDIAAESMGVSLLKTKIQAFAQVHFIVKSLFAFTYLKSLEPVAFDIKLSLRFYLWLYWVVRTINGAFGAALFYYSYLITGNNVFHGAIDATIISAIEQVVFGA